MRKVVILQARLGSSRFPDKVIAEISGKPVIAHIIDRLKCSTAADEVCVAIPNTPAEDKLASLLEEYPVTICRGSENDVLSRFIHAAYQTKAEIIVRAKASNPLVDPVCMDKMIEFLEGNPETEYVTTENLPFGVTTEVFRLKTLEKLDYLAKHPNLRKHVTLYLNQNPSPFAAEFHQPADNLARKELRLSLNSRDDYQLINTIYDRLYQDGSIISIDSVIELLDSDPELSAMAMLKTAVTAG